jgi:iodotyrosine deiodinase
MDEPEYIPFDQYREYAPHEMQQRAADYYQDLRRRRTVREFSDRTVPEGVIRDCLKAAGRAPSGANQQPWHFVAVTNPAMKHRIREAAEKEEHAFYEHRAPCLIAIFAQKYGFDAQGNKIKHYYVKASVGIATGFLITALHHAGLVSLTYTPSPMDFLNNILQRPENEKAFMILVTGYPEKDVTVPNISKKSLEEIVTWL